MRQLLTNTGARARKHAGQACLTLAQMLGHHATHASCKWQHLRFKHHSLRHAVASNHEPAHWNAIRLLGISFYTHCRHSAPSTLPHSQPIATRAKRPPRGQPSLMHSTSYLGRHQFMAHAGKPPRTSSSASRRRGRPTPGRHDPDGEPHPGRPLSQFFEPMVKKVVECVLSPSAGAP